MIKKINKIHELTDLSREDLYLDYLERFSSNLGEIENNPFLGFIGKNYFESRSKICFIARAGAESRYLSDEDIRMNKYFMNFKKSELNNRFKYFWDYQEVLKNHISNWPVFKIPKYLNSKTNKDINNISYLNIVPYRYKGRPIKIIYKIAWENYTNKLLEILSPHIIIPLGKHLEDEIKTNYQGISLVVNGITRTNGDNYLHNDAINEMDKIAKLINSEKKL